MPVTSIQSTPLRSSYDVVIVGGAIIGSSIAWFLSVDPSFDGSVLVVERDPSYEFSSTARTNSCMRQQFSNEINITMSQFGADFVRNFRHYMGDDPDVPELAVNHFGYLYLASDDAFAQALRANQLVQQACGAGTKILGPDEIVAQYPFYNVEDIICGSHNLIDEGYFDGGTLFDWWRKKARQNGVEYVSNEVTAIARERDRVSTVTLRDGATIACGVVVNASGPRAAQTAAMVGLDLPVEPRRRYTFMIQAEEPLDRDLPLTIDPSGVHVRTDGPYYMTGCTPDHDPAVDPADFAFVDPDIFETKVWPALAHRIPAFERIKVVSKWTGHYAYNRLDQNAVVGTADELSNFVFANGFSGHGLQHSPAIGRGVAELIVHGSYKSLDLSPFSYQRIVENRPFVETAVI